MTTEGQKPEACEMCRSQPSAWVSPTGHVVCPTCLFNEIHRTVLEAYDLLSACCQQLDVIGDWIVNNDSVKPRNDYR